MGKIKKIKVPKLHATSQGDIFDRAFWDEFYRREDASVQRATLTTENERDGRDVTVTIRDEATGEEWEIRGVKLMSEGKKRLAS